MIKKHLPNFITVVNLFCGCCALASVFYGQFVLAFFFSLASGVADFLDGMLARFWSVHSPVGKQLDSLADMVSFGVVPGAILYMLLVKGFSKAEVLPIQLTLKAAPAFLVSIFAAIRLANFNLDVRQKDKFIGLPTPSCAIFAVGLVLIHHYDSLGWGTLVTHPSVVYPLIPVLCFLLIAEFPMFSFKFEKLEWAGNQIRFIFAGVSVLLLVFLREAAIALLIPAYILFSTLDNYLSRHLNSH